MKNSTKTSSLVFGAGGEVKTTRIKRETHGASFLCQCGCNGKGLKFCPSCGNQLIYDEPDKHLPY